MGENQQLHLHGVHFPSDASLTLPNVLAAVRTVQDVGTLEHVLKVPYTKRYEVERQSASSEGRRDELVKYYVDTSPNASWEHLGGRLLYCGEHAAMKKVKVHIKSTEGEYIAMLKVSWESDGLSLKKLNKLNTIVIVDVRYCTS